MRPLWEPVGRQVKTKLLYVKKYSYLCTLVMWCLILSFFTTQKYYFLPNAPRTLCFLALLCLSFLLHFLFELKFYIPHHALRLGVVPHPFPGPVAPVPEGRKKRGRRGCFLIIGNQPVANGRFWAFFRIFFVFFSVFWPRFGGGFAYGPAAVGVG